MITFEEDQSYGYRERTIKNASADITLAFAIDFNSAGERLTKSSVPKNKKYFPIHPIGDDGGFMKMRIDQIALGCFGYVVESINIAGNGIYTMKSKFTQEDCDDFTYRFLFRLLDTNVFHNTQQVKLIRSGGQSGFDEAGLKAAVRLGIPALCLAPKGWKFRDINGVDVSNEKQFKARFL